MPSESDRWKTGPLRNTIGHTEGATGAVTGGTEGHVKAEDRKRREGKRPAAVEEDPSRFTGAG